MTVHTDDRKRRYELRARAERQAETRRRITEAAVALHEEVGPARTTISAVAERAGVQRLTVYRHFPDEATLIDACSAHWSERNAPPDPGRWAAERDPERRLRAALDELYGWFTHHERMITNVLRDAEGIARLAEHAAEFPGFFDACADLLADGWGVRGRRRELLRAAVRHAVDFGAWQALRRQGVARADAVELMARLATGVRDGAPAPRRRAAPGGG